MPISNSIGAKMMLAQIGQDFSELQGVAGAAEKLFTVHAAAIGSMIGRLDTSAILAIGLTWHKF
jgi:hypothetical protein